jgi:hypothetical protein
MLFPVAIISKISLWMDSINAPSLENELENATSPSGSTETNATSPSGSTETNATSSSEREPQQQSQQHIQTCPDGTVIYDTTLLKSPTTSNGANGNDDNNQHPQHVHVCPDGSIIAVA